MALPDCGTFPIKATTSTLTFLIYALALLAVCGLIGQFLMAVIVGILLDSKRLGGRRRRAFIGWGFLFVLINAVVIGGVFPARRSQRGVPPAHLLDVYDSEASGYIALYAFYGAVGGAWQTLAWWIMGTLSHDPLVLSIYSAFYKRHGSCNCI